MSRVWPVVLDVLIVNSDKRQCPGTYTVDCLSRAVLTFLRFTRERNNALQCPLLILGSIGSSGPIDPIVITCELTHMKLWPNSNTDSCIRIKKIPLRDSPIGYLHHKICIQSRERTTCRTSAGSCSNRMYECQLR